MWDDLANKQKESYKKLILAFASLSDAFAQKTEKNKDKTVVPFINSKFQETVFQKAFNATGEDIGNTSFDASLKLDQGDQKKKYLIGIKTFRFTSGYQKIAQFKRSETEWASTIAAIQNNATDPNGRKRSKKEIDQLNNEYYKELAIAISQLRNMRIESSKAMLKGFKIAEDDDVEAIYHVIMPFVTNNLPKLNIGETTYTPIDIDSIEVLGCTTVTTPANFNFKDKNHYYRFTAADAQLLMAFDNANIVKETWDVKYIEDVFEFFTKISEDLYGKDDDEKIVESYSWKIPTDDDGEVMRYSGLNNFNSLGPKTPKKDRPAKIEKIYQTLLQYTDKKTADEIKELLFEYMMGVFPGSQKEVQKAKEVLRQKILKLARSIKSKEVMDLLLNFLYRDQHEMYIPISNARKFHKEHPDFFSYHAGELEKDNKTLKQPKDKRTFIAKFDPSGDIMECFITQQSGKGIESLHQQSILGQWIHNNIFQLGSFEALTTKKLNELNLNGIRVYRTNKDDYVHIRFIWIDDDNLPDDYFE